LQSPPGPQQRTLGTGKLDPINAHRSTGRLPPSGQPLTACRSRSAASFLSACSRGCNCGFTDADLDDAVCVALTGLIQSAA
jgi:hypothetical protein